MEELELTDPVTTPAQTKNKYHVVSMLLDMETTVELPPTGKPGLISIRLKDNLQQPFMHQYTGQEAIDFMKFMNTANFSVNSMHKRVLQKLSNDGVLPGTVTGTPDPPPVIE